MREILRQVVFGVASLCLVGALCSMGQAFPGTDTDSCTTCHNDPAGIDYEAAPTLLTLAPGGSGDIAFDILALPDETAGALVIRGLNDPLLDLASIGAVWLDKNPTGNQYYQNFPVLGLGTPSLEILALVIGPLATPGDYPITAQFVSSNGFGVTANGGFLDLTLRIVVPDLLLGDVNLDDSVNGLDVDPFVALVTEGTYQAEGDMNEDDAVNGLDVDPFVAAVVGGAAAVPEPSTIALAAFALLALVGFNWRRNR
jgi:hypothetical protein